jgi:5-methylcytosine-specific restriction endonuclease McrA
VKRYLCPSPNCFSIVDAPGRYCAAHAWKQAEKDRAKAAAATRRWDEHHARIDYAWVWADPRWKKIRARRRKEEPNCRRCSAPACIVDHVRPHRGDEALAFDYENTQSLCRKCDAQKSREDREVQ